MCRISKLLNQVCCVLLLVVVSTSPACRISSKNPPLKPLQTLLESTDIELIHTISLHFDTCHVQGLDLTEQFYFVTSVDREHGRAWLFKIDKQTGALNSQKDLTDGQLIHPGGIQFDGQYLWIPNAEYRRESRTMIHRIDPNGLEIERSFPVDDHIGAVASDGKGLLFGVNWDAIHFYTWDFDGHQLGKVDSPTSMAYQDIKYCNGKLLCSAQKDGQSFIDVIDPETWSLVQRINLPRDRWKTGLSREGMAFDGNLYFLPDDGPNSVILVFALH
jgi:glutamine cyclotransferase